MRSTRRRNGSSITSPRRWRRAWPRSSAIRPSIPTGTPFRAWTGRWPTWSRCRCITLAPGEPARVQRVSDRDPQRLRYLEELGIRPGVTIQVLEALPFDGPLRLDVSGVEQMIGRPLAAVVQVAPPRRRSAGQVDSR